MKCDRCGEAFAFSPNFESGNAIQRCVKGEDEYSRYPISASDIRLCPSCMAALNDWLKGEQERQAKWIYDHERNSIECDKCRAEYKLSPYERVSDFDYCPNCGAKMEE